MLLNGEHTGRARPARRRRLALAGALACLAVLVQAAPAPASPTNASPPGTPQRTGRTLIADNGSWLVARSYSYAWYRCDGAGAGCLQVPGRSGSSYLLTTADIGRRIRSLVTASNEVGSESAFSSPTATITALAPANQVLPRVSGRARRGSTLSSTLGIWADPSPDALSYRRQWQRCTREGSNCQSIAGATGPSYTLGARDMGRLVRVSVSAEGLGVATVASARVGPVAGPLAPGADPPTGGFRKLRPFPVVLLAGRHMRGRTHIARLVVRGPRGAMVSLRCRGRGCPRRSFRAKLGRSGRIALRRFQRTYAPKATIEIRVTGRRAIGKFTRIRIRATLPPSRRDSCLVPGAARPSRCG